MTETTSTPAQPADLQELIKALQQLQLLGPVDRARRAVELGTAAKSVLSAVTDAAVVEVVELLGGTRPAARALGLASATAVQKRLDRVHGDRS